MPGPTIYFGFGSNIWKDQVQRRCSTSKPLGIARIPAHRWFIAELGGANIMHTGSEDDEVWGMAYTLQPDDEAELDVIEKVSTGHFKKEMIEAEVWPFKDHGRPADTTKTPRKAQVLVYISHERTKTGRPRDEYVVRMNHSIEVALQEGIPSTYIENVLRQWIAPQNPA